MWQKSQCQLDYVSGEDMVSTAQSSWHSCGRVSNDGSTISIKVTTIRFTTIVILFITDLWHHKVDLLVFKPWGCDTRNNDGWSRRKVMRVMQHTCIADESPQYNCNCLPAKDQNLKRFGPHLSLLSCTQWIVIIFTNAAAKRNVVRYVDEQANLEKPCAFH